MRIASLAVLPLANLSGDPEQEYFADGMTEEIINALARLPDLRVVARTSAFAFKDKDADIRTIGEQLGVRHVVEGSVRRSGERLRVTAQLISVADGYHLWSETYDRDVADVFAIQEEVATKVAEALSVRIGGRSLAQAPPPDRRAYELYLTGRQLFGLRTEAWLRRAIEHFEQALALAPSYAPALSGLADALTLLTVWGIDRSPAVLERAREAPGVADRGVAAFRLHGERRVAHERADAEDDARHLVEVGIPAAGAGLQLTLRSLDCQAEFRIFLCHKPVLDICVHRRPSVVS